MDVQPTQCLNIACVEKAAMALGFSYSFFDKNKNFIEVKTPYGPKTFINCTSPANQSDLVRLAEDKEFTYLFLSSHINMPRTIGYFDPDALAEFDQYKNFHSQEDIAIDISHKFELPVIIKMNNGSQGRNVFKCESINDIRRALKKIYNKKNLKY
mgnify:FL=1